MRCALRIGVDRGCSGGDCVAVTLDWRGGRGVGGAVPLGVHSRAEVA